jgi:glycosyl transferase family 87
VNRYTLTSTAARRTSLRVGVVILALLAAPRVAFETWRLLFGQTWYDATDIKNFHNLTMTWLSGQDIYATVANADYPPASYPLMFPMYVLDNDINRWVWFAHAVIVLGALIWMCVRESGAESTAEKLCVVLLPLAMFSTGVAFGNGQLVIHALTASTAAMLLLYNSRGRVAWELAAAACMLFALVKPNLTAPFFWIFLLVPRRKHAAAYVIVGYVLLTMLGASLQPASLVDQFRGFVARGLAVTAQFTGYGAVPMWLIKAGLPNLIMPFTLVALLAMGIWVWANRHADRWLLYGGLAIMTRLWAYHQLYDDVLNLFAFIALIRLAKGRAGNQEPDNVAWVVLLVAMTTLPGPATPLRFDSGWISLVVGGWQTAVRFLMLAFIMHRVWMQRNRPRERLGDARLLIAQTAPS